MCVRTRERLVRVMQSAAMMPATLSVACTRSLGCKCPECDLSFSALGDVVRAPSRPSPVAEGSRCGGAASPLGAGAYTFAAFGYNERRTLGAPYDADVDGKLGSVYTMLAELLAHRGDWAGQKASRSKVTDAGHQDEVHLPRSFQLLLGPAQGRGIRFSQLGYGMWPPPLVNYYRGFNGLCRKAALIQLLRAAGLTSVMPETFLFYPARRDAEELNEYGPLEAAFRAVEGQGEGGGANTNLWILKPSDGAKGERIEVMRDLGKMQAFLQSQSESESGRRSGWVVQRYVDRPLLLRGGRKFDVRCWVVVDADYNAYLYREGVLRTGAVPYVVTAENLGDKFVHLTNHCIAATHPDYGKFEATNEMFYAEFGAYLEEAFPGSVPAGQGSVLDAVILPQFRRIVAQTVAAARDTMEVRSEYYRSFHLFGYDFLIDDALKVWLCEINASPAVAEQLMPKLVRDLIAVAIDPVLPAFGGAASDDGQNDRYAHARATWAADLAAHRTDLVAPHENGFELVAPADDRGP